MKGGEAVLNVFELLMTRSDGCESVSCLEVVLVACRSCPSELSLDRLHVYHKNQLNKMPALVFIYCF
jgi:hypothetical protein